MSYQRYGTLASGLIGATSAMVGLVLLPQPWALVFGVVVAIVAGALTGWFWPSR